MTTLSCPLLFDLSTRMYLQLMLDPEFGPTHSFRTIQVLRFMIEMKDSSPLSYKDPNIIATRALQTNFWLIRVHLEGSNHTPEEMFDIYNRVSEPDGIRNISGSILPTFEL